MYLHNHFNIHQIILQITQSSFIWGSRCPSWCVSCFLVGQFNWLKREIRFLFVWSHLLDDEKQCFQMIYSTYSPWDLLSSLQTQQVPIWKVLGSNNNRILWVTTSLALFTFFHRHRLSLIQDSCTLKCEFSIKILWSLGSWNICPETQDYSDIGLNWFCSAKKSHC